MSCQSAPRDRNPWLHYGCERRVARRGWQRRLYLAKISASQREGGIAISAKEKKIRLLFFYMWILKIERMFSGFACVFCSARCLQQIMHACLCPSGTQLIIYLEALMLVRTAQ